VDFAKSAKIHPHKKELKFKPIAKNKFIQIFRKFEKALKDT